MKSPKDLSLIFALLVITGALFSGCSQTSPVVDSSTTTQETSTIISQETSEVSLSTTQEENGSSMESQEINNGTSTSQTTQETQGTTVSTVSYKNGTYSESASYKSPAGNEDVTFQFTIADNTITGVELATKSENAMSQKFQGFFMEGIQKEVIGKKLNELGTFSRVNGSSLTPKAFNEAVSALKEKVKA